MEQEAERAGKIPTVSTSMPQSVPEEAIDRALTCGGTEKGSVLRIIAFYQKSPGDGEAADFLKDEYGSGGIGIDVNGAKYAIWHDGEGIFIAAGRRAKAAGCTLIPWEEAGQRIRQLLQEGRYASQEQLDAAWDNGYRELAEKLCCLCRDTAIGAAGEGFLPYLSELYLQPGDFPEATVRIADALRDGEKNAVLAGELEAFAQAYKKNKKLMRFPIYTPGKLLGLLMEMDIQPVQFRAAEGFEAEKGSFVTEDEIDSVLTDGSAISEKKMQVYSYYMQGHNPMECAALLKAAHGTGGHGCGRCWEWHDSKGMRITGEDSFSSGNVYDTVQLDWKKAEARVRAIIRENRYLNPREMAYIPEYEKLQLARRIYSFHYFARNAQGKGYFPWDSEAAARDYRPMLDSPKLTAILYQDMAETFAAIQPGDTKDYGAMKEALEDMGAFTRGEYSLFTPLPEPVLQKQRMERKAARKAAREKQEEKSLDAVKTSVGGEKEKGAGKEPQGSTNRRPKESREGELAAAARALSRKQKSRTREGQDGQLSFDFSAPDISGTGQQPAGEAEVPNMAELERQPAANLGTPTTEERKTEEKGAVAESEPEQEMAAIQEPDQPAGMGQEAVAGAKRDDAPVEAAGVKPDMETAQNQEADRETVPAREPEGETAADTAETAQVPQPMEAAQPPTGLDMGKEAIPEKSAAVLYREALYELVETIKRGSLYPYLRDRNTTYDEVAAEMDGHLEHFIDSIEESQPELYRAFQTLPMFREWMAEDILGRTYQDSMTDPRDAVVRHAGEPDAPEWVQDAAGAGELDSAEMEEAKQLIADFCYDEYGAERMDFSNPEHLGVAWTSIEDERHEIEVLAEVDLVNPSACKLVDGTCVEKREYGSLRELIDKELCVMDYVELLRLDNVPPEALLEAGIPEEQLPEVMGGMGLKDGTAAEGQTAQRQEVALQDIISGEAVEIEGGQVVEADTARISGKALPYDIAVQKMRSGSDRHNFHITDENQGAGGQKAKFQDNLAAIRTLKQIEEEDRLAAPEEQETLSRYVGWGGIAQAFDPDNGKWAKEYAELKEALTPEEYASARGSVLNAHYTSPIVIGAVYEALGRMDFTPGNILEPSCGIGNFFGLLPEKYGGSKLYGVELDSLTGRIAGQLYQDADIAISGFEHTGHPDDFFDLAVGNVPFGDYKVHDRRYDRKNLLVHDYFLTKALDKVRPGGIMAFITTKGTLDKANSSAREGLAQKADLLGAIRLPNDAFLKNAGTSVTADILFFQKRGSAPEKLPDWVHAGQTESGIPLNNYFLQHPEMVLGRMEFVSNMYGSGTETACLPIEGRNLKEQLAEAIRNIAPPDRGLLQMDAPGQEGPGEGEIPADPGVRNFSFTEKDRKIYFRENSRMKPAGLKGLPAARARGMIAIRDSARRLIDMQLGGAGDAEIKKGQEELNFLYDAFQKKYGLLNSPGNRQVFRSDSSYPLLSSLEVLDGEGNFKCKADLFSKRTINYRSPVSSVDTAVEALGVSIGERACVDLGFMASLMGGNEKIPQIVSDLKGIIFKDPATGPFDPGLQVDNWDKGWQAADEYLSGNVRQKLELARAAAGKHPGFAVNVEALEKVQPKELSAAEISVRIGAPWIDTKYYKQFLAELLQVPARTRQKKLDVLYSEATGEWRVKRDSSMVSATDTRVWNTYGSKRRSAYEIFEDTLNQRSVQVFDIRTNEEGREVRVLNEKQTAIAQQKQEAIKGAFQDWIFKDPERRSELCATYNRMFNSVRPREYDGQHIVFSGMNPEKKLEAHQRNAVARVLYGKNTLLAHVVGAGKTYEMVAAAMEGKRLGLFRKSMVVVPNHLTEQWGSDFLALYPGAKVLVATRRDFEQKNRKRFCARIATGDFDAVIIGHSQFERIPLSVKRQEAVIQGQIDEVMEAIAEIKDEKGERFTIKQMERQRKGLEARIQKLHDKKKDDAVTFEELGIDHLFVDEAHAFKNLFLHTKMRNVAGISQTDAQKSSDMFAKCRYLDDVICCEL